MDGESEKNGGQARLKDDSVIHKPVMLQEVLDALSPLAGKVIVDATFGAGGYSRALLTAGAAAVYGNDRDPFAQSIAAELAREDDRFHPLSGTFSDLSRHFASGAFPLLDGLVADLGVSSMQLDQKERGFSFMHDGPLDMRMSQSGETAADIVNIYEEKPLADLIYQYGEERYSRRIAKAIVSAREDDAITSTARLADIIRGAVPAAARYDRLHPATRSFQALRIAVNDELGEVEALLKSAPAMLRPGGRLIIVSFHSLEDRLVKKGLSAGRKPAVNRHMPDVVPSYDPTLAVEGLQLLTKRAVMPGDVEISENPRSRSARMRVALKPAFEGR